MKVKIFPIKLQMSFLFIPLINIFAGYIMMYKNTRQFKNYFWIIFSTFIGFLIGALLLYCFSLIDLSQLGAMATAFQLLKFFIIILPVLISWIICQNKCIKDEINNGEIIIENKKLFLVKQ